MSTQVESVVWIDAELVPSRLLYWYQLGLFALLIIIGLGMSYAWWQWLLLALVAIVIWLGVRALYPKTLQKLVIDDNLCVQCLLSTHLGDELWRGQLMSCQRKGHYVLLHMSIDEPREQKVRFCIFCDQLAPDDFRKICVLARFLPSSQISL